MPGGPTASVGSELGVGGRWLIARLSGDATLTSLAPGGVHAYRGGAVLPAVAIAAQSPAGDVEGLGGVRIASSQLWLVRAVTYGPGLATAEAIATRIDEVLQASSGTVAGRGRVLACTREGGYDLPEVDGSDTYHYQGGYYRLLVQSDTTAT